MSIAPVKRSVQVRAAPARAFELFATRMGDWWPKGKTVGKDPHVAIVVEPVAGGRWFERDSDGVEVQWGKVLAWEPPARLLLGWQLNSEFTYDPDLVTEVELTFAPSEGGTLVKLEHRHLERFGDAAERIAASLAGGVVAAPRSIRRLRRRSRLRGAAMPDIMHLVTIDAAPALVFDALATADGVRSWWTRDADLAAHVGGRGEFRFYGGSKITQVEIVELTPSARVGWKVLDSFRSEWRGTTITFDLRPDDDGTKLLFAHRGFPLPDDDYALCTTGWGIYLGSLKTLLEGDARPPR